jgi:hypothetical protein
MAGVIKAGASGSEPPVPGYNLFRRVEDPEFFCAVAQDKPVPAFLTSDVWQFAGSEPEAMQQFLAQRAAHVLAGDQLDGFYLFHARRHVQRPAVPEMEEAA